MASYRFCRPDDIPFLVRAVNECYDVHFPDSAPMTLDRFRTEMKELDVWPSNSLVASTNAGPVAVLIGTKRAREVLVSRVGVHPDHMRQGHASHIVTSLSQKLAVLGPDRLVAEVPRALPGIGDFFEAVHYQRERTFVDQVRRPAPVEPVPDDWLIPTTVNELIDQELLAPDPDVAWERSYDTLVACKGDLGGLAVASPERLEAYLLFRAVAGAACVDVVAIGARPSEQEDLFLTLLLRGLAGTTGGSLRIPKLGERELSATVLSGLGFEPGEVYDRYAAVATPA